MISDLFVKLLFGHVVGDYFLQPAAMATKKGSANWLCALHVTIYTAAIALFTTWAWKWLVFVWISHFVVDRFSLADRWLKLIRGRALEEFLLRGHEGIPEGGGEEFRENYHALRGAFSALVYAVVDNSMHLISMYYAFPYLQ